MHHYGMRSEDQVDYPHERATPVAPAYSKKYMDKKSSLFQQASFL